MRHVLHFGVLVLLVGLVPSESKKIVNVAMPAPGTACTTKVTFPIKSFKGLTGYPYITEVFGIPIIGTEKFKTSGKMQFAASILAELLDNDNDGCVDDPNVLAHLLKRSPNDFGGPPTRKSLFLINKDTDKSNDEAAEKLGYVKSQFTYFNECLPNKAGLKAIGARDATMEEWLHFMNDNGHTPAYPKIFGNKWTSKSTLTNAMDIARGGRIQKTPAKKTGYSAEAWYTYCDTSCKYFCQATEYLWWGYVAYSGIGNGLANTAEFSNEFAFLLQADFKDMDVDLTKIFQDSADKKAVYRLPTKPVDGTYTGCKTCNAGTNHGGS